MRQAFENYITHCCSAASPVYVDMWACLSAEGQASTTILPQISHLSWLLFTLFLQCSQRPKYWGHTIVAPYLEVVYPLPSAKHPWGQTPSKTREWMSIKALTDRWWQGSCQTEHTDEIRISLISWGVTNQFGGIWTCCLPLGCCIHDFLKTIWVGLFDGVMLWVGGLGMSLGAMAQDAL